MGNSLLCHYIDNCFKKGIILWGQKHCNWGGKVEEWGPLPPSSNVKKGSVTEARRLAEIIINYFYKENEGIDEPKSLFLVSINNFYR